MMPYGGLVGHGAAAEQAGRTETDMLGPCLGREVQLLAAINLRPAGRSPEPLISFGQ